MDEVDAKLRSMRADRAGDIILELILLLVAQYRKGGDRRNELVVTVGLETADRLRGRAEWESQREAEIPIALRRGVQIALIEGERSQPIGTERILVADHRAPVVVMGRGAGGRQGCLLDKSIVGCVVVHRRAQEPMRLGRG